MSLIVPDASVAIKWLVPESGTSLALKLRGHRMVAPDLLVVECANVLWRMVQRGELTRSEAAEAERDLTASDVRLVPMRTLAARALDLAMELGHPACDCFYLALAEQAAAVMVTADMRLLARLSRAPPHLAALALGLNEAAEQLSR